MNASNLKSTTVIPDFERESKSLSVLNILSSSLTQKKAHDAYQAGDFKQAETNYLELLANNPYDAQNNYNLGSVLYKQQKFDDASGYFNRAIEKAEPKSPLQEQALFNRGNNFVQQKKLDEAINDYKKVLEINPKNDSAKNNLKIVEQMKKDQKKQDQQKSKDKNKDDKKQDQQQDQNDQSEKSEQKKDQSQNDQNSSDGQSKEQNRNEQGQKKDKEQSKKEQEEGLEKSKNKKSESGKDQKHQKEEKTEHTKSSQKSQQEQEQSAKSQDVGKEEVKLDDAYAKDLTEKPSDDERLEKRSAMLLDKLDDYEKNIQKKLLQMNVTKQGVQKHGQKNW